jgi:hypothetical protein
VVALLRQQLESSWSRLVLCERKPTREWASCVVSGVRYAFNGAAGGDRGGDVEARAAQWLEEVATCAKERKASASFRKAPRKARECCDSVAVARFSSSLTGQVQCGQLTWAKRSM